MGSHFLVGLDLGTANLKVAVAEEKNGRPLLRAIFKEPSAGVRKGSLMDVADALPVVSRALNEVKKISKSALKNVYANVGTYQIKAQHSRGIVAVSRADSEIYQDDIDRAIKASQAVNLAPNRLLIHNITREYVVDGVGDIVDPLGLSGNRLEVNSLVVDVFAPHVKTIMRLAELAGGRVNGLALDPILSARAALSKNQKDLGVVLIDIGAGTTGVSVYEENKLVGVAVFPVGASNITNDLAVGLKVPVAAAENIKLNYGYAYAKDVSAKETIELAKFASDNHSTVSRRFVSEIIESRLAEIFEFVNNELKLWGKMGQLPGGAVLVGGGAKLPGLTRLAKQELKLSAQIGLTATEGWSAESSGLNEVFEDPEFANVLGLVLWGADREQWYQDEPSFSFRLKNIIHYFLP